MRSAPIPAMWHGYAEVWNAAHSLVIGTQTLPDHQLAVTRSGVPPVHTHIDVRYEVMAGSALGVLPEERGRSHTCLGRTHSRDMITSRSSCTDGRTGSLVTFERYRPVVLFGLRSRCYLAISFGRLTPPGSSELERGFDSRSMERGG